jgi:hypothetical protein
MNGAVAAMWTVIAVVVAILVIPGLVVGRVEILLSRQLRQLGDLLLRATGHRPLNVDVDAMTASIVYRLLVEGRKKPYPDPWVFLSVDARAIVRETIVDELSYPRSE